MPDSVERRLVVDRFEGDLVVVEVDGSAVLDLPRWMLPDSVREGDVIRLSVTSGSDQQREFTLRIDAEETRRSRDEAAARLERLRARDPGGDIHL